MLRSLPVAAALLLLVLAPAAARDPERKARVTIKGVGADGEDTSRQTAELTKDIAWKATLDEAKAAAKKDGKLIFWLHILGDLDGTT
jgi:hypothetical protein